MARRSYGTGSLTTRTDAAGRETWVGQWRTGSRKLKRRIGPVRVNGVGLTRGQAEAELRRLIGETEPSAQLGERVTVQEAGARYLRHLETSGRKPVTIAAVRGHLKHWHEPFFHGKSLDQIQPEDIVDLIALMQAGNRPGGLRRTKPLSPKTIRNAIGTLNALYRYALKRRWAVQNPVQGVDLPDTPTSDEIRCLTPVEVRAAARAVPAGPYERIDRALILTAAMTGLRVGELIALRWQDVDWSAGRVRVRRNYDSRNPGDGYGTPKTRRSSRSVPMSDEVAGELDRLHQAAKRKRDHDLVFADPVTGGPLSKRCILLRFRAALRAAKLDDAHRVHDLRHSFGTAMAGAGVPMRTLQEWMGHRDIATTQRYADYAPAPAHEAALIAQAFATSGVVALTAGEIDRVPIDN